jgi:decaprenylphospho-beta-D-ribofuranose 2-oxidase
LREATAAGERITLRAGGTSFDEQALGSNVVISMLDMKGIAVDPKAHRVQVGAGVTWGEIFEETLRFGLLPPIVVTTRRATAGGTLASHSISRFTPALGREGHHVRDFRLMMLDGTVLECSRSQNADLFGAVIGGLGYAGAVTSVTYALTPAPCAASKLVVESTFTKLTGVRSMVDRLLQSALAEGDGALPSASSAVIHLHGPRHSLFATSRYASGTEASRKRCVFHCPGSLGHLVLQLAAQSHWLRRVTEPTTIERMYEEGLTELRLVRARHGLVGKLENGFSARVLPSLHC